MIKSVTNTKDFPILELTIVSAVLIMLVSTLVPFGIGYIENSRKAADVVSANAIIDAAKDVEAFTANTEYTHANLPQALKDKLSGEWPEIMYNNKNGEKVFVIKVDHNNELHIMNGLGSNALEIAPVTDTALDPGK